MTLPLPPSAPSELSDRLVAEIVEGLAARLQAGEPVDLEACAREHPECADRLRQLLPAVRMLADLGRSAGGAAGLPPTGGPAPGPAAGTLGDYRVLREVGRGGMGVVYEAEQISLGRRVALKVLAFAAVLDPRHLQRFQNEARAAACLHHPNIVPVYGVGTDRGTHYYAMQFIEGPTLAALIQGLRRQPRRPADKETGRQGDKEKDATGSLPGTVADAGQATAVSLSPCLPVSLSDFFRTVARLGVQAAEALEHAHQAGVVHRDVKPANLMVDARGTLWVTDFGLAVCQSDTGVTRSGDLIGTLRYMSPEQALGRRRALDHRTDVYSLGATLYELLTLEPAFGGDDRQELLRRIASEEPRPARRLNPAVPADLETIVAKAMAKAPDERYATAQELAEDLRRYLEDRPIRARRPSLWQKGRKWARRNEPVVWGLALFTALALLGSLLGAVVYAGKAKEQEQARRQTESKLYRALLDEVAALRLARRPGYRAEVWEKLHEAVQLGVPEHNPDHVRDEVVACLGDPIGLAALDDARAPLIARAERPRVAARWDQAVRDEYKEAGIRAPFPEKYPRAVSADDQVLAFSVLSSLIHLRPRDRTAWHWELLTGLGGVYDLAFTPDRQSLIAGCEEGIIVWDVSSLPLLAPVRWSSRSGNVLSVAAQPGGRLLAAGGRRLELWSLDYNRLVASLEPPVGGVKVEFSADGKWLLAVKGDRAVAGWPVTDTPERRLLHADRRGVPSVAFSPDGRRLACGTKSGTAQLWDVASGRLLHTCRAATRELVHVRTVESVAFSPDGRLLAGGDLLGALYLWDAETGKEVAQRPEGGASLPGGVWRLRFSATGRYVAAGGAMGVAVWDLRAGVEALTRKPFLSVRAPDAGTGRAPTAQDLAIHPDESALVFLTDAGQLYRLDLAKGAEARPLGPRAGAQLRALEFDRAGERFTYLTPSGTLATYDWRTGETRDTDQKAFQVALNERWAATPNRAGEVILYDLEAGRRAYTLPAEGSDVWGLAFSPDGTRLAVALSDGGVAVWDLEQVRARLAEFAVHLPSTARP
jgi:serine/threonine protein kinase/WD40 repeat protein